MDNLSTLMELRRWAKYGKLLPGLIHNINTPLMGISGRTELIQIMHPEVTGTEQIMDQLLLINKMLTSFSVLLDEDKNRQPVSIDLNDLIHQMDALYYADMQYKHQLKVDLKLGSPLPIMINQGCLQFAIAEIIQNAIDYTPKGGTITWLTGREENTYFIEITNTSPAIPADILEHLGVAGYTARPEHEGLGIWFAKESLKEINGNLTVQNTETGVLSRIEISKG